MNVVKLKKSDMKDALELVWLVFQEFEAPEYSLQGITSFKDFISYDSIIDKFDEHKIVFWGHFVSGSLVGVIAVRDNSHICLLFVKKEYQRQGIARKLFETVLKYCKSLKDVNSITVNSSPYAVNVYHHLGFIDMNAEQTVNGIRFTPMKYDI